MISVSGPDSMRGGRANLTRRKAHDDPWRKRLTELGADARQIRERLGLSQEQVARAAGVSQGAVSRFEQARGLSVPLVGMLRIHLVLAHAVKRLDPKTRTDEMKQLFRRLDVLHVGDDPSLPAWPIGRNPNGFDVASDAHLARTIRDWSELPEPKRLAFVGIIEGIARAMKGA